VPPGQSPQRSDRSILIDVFSIYPLRHSYVACLAVTDNRDAIESDPSGSAGIYDRLIADRLIGSSLRFGDPDKVYILNVRVLFVHFQACYSRLSVMRSSVCVRVRVVECIEVRREINRG